MPDAQGRTATAASCAIIVNDHASDTSGFVDVFYMYFYAFNYGTYITVLNNPFVLDPYPIGNHVGDWEHTMIRFSSDGTPLEMWFSQHDNGEAFTYDALEKSGVRPVVYSANGSHANYATQVRLLTVYWR
jgi:Vacuolar protein sorting-associated protein 62